MIFLEDSTGSTIVTFYQKGDHNIPPALREFEYREGESQWVRVHGFIRVFNEQKNVVGINLQQITKMDDITNHFLKVFVAHNIRHKGVLDHKDLDAAKPVKANPVSAAGQNQTQTVLNLMKEICRNSRFAHKNDLWTIC
jgi:hypothetical protein